MLQLRYAEQGVPKTHRLTQGVTVIGRLPSCDLVLSDSSVSRHHATLRVVDAECRLTDSGSRFGTFLEGVPVHDEVAVKVGATIRCGEVVLVLEQAVAEKDLLSEDHQISEGPGTIMRPISAAIGPSSLGESQLIRL